MLTLKFGSSINDAIQNLKDLEVLQKKNHDVTPFIHVPNMLLSNSEVFGKTVECKTLVSNCKHHT